MFSVIANKPLDLDGQHYEPGDTLSIHGASHGILLVKGVVRLATAPAPPPADTPKRKRGRPRKADTSAPSYQRRDLRAEE